MKTVEVKAREGVSVPTPYGLIGSKKTIEVPMDLFIRRRLAEGDLILTTAKKKQQGQKSGARKNRRTS